MTLDWSPGFFYKMNEKVSKKIIYFCEVLLNYNNNQDKFGSF